MDTGRRADAAGAAGAAKGEGGMDRPQFDRSEMFKRARPAEPARLTGGEPERGPWVVVLVAPSGEEVIRIAEGLTEARAWAMAADPKDWLEQARESR